MRQVIILHRTKIATVRCGCIARVIESVNYLQKACASLLPAVAAIYMLHFEEFITAVAFLHVSNFVHWYRYHSCLALQDNAHSTLYSLKPLQAHFCKPTDNE
jgi:hypothetical protein